MKIFSPVNKSILVLLIFLCSLNTSLQAQKKSERKKVAYEQLDQLKNGALLVRLQTRELAITALRKVGRDSEANELVKSQMKINRDILKAFRLNFKFAPVYFFYSNFSAPVIGGETDKVVFLNDSLQPDTSIKFTMKSFLTGEFAPVEKAGFGAALLLDNKLQQLKKPFPFYARTFETFALFRRTRAETVQKLNSKIEKFYTKRLNTKT